MIESINVALDRAAKAIGSGDRDKRASSSGPTRLRDVVGVTDISAVGTAPAAPTRTRKPEPDADDRAPLREQSVPGADVISSGKSVAQTLMFIFRGNVNKQLSLNARFGMGNVQGDTEGASYFPANSYDVQNEYGPQSYYSKYAGMVRRRKKPLPSPAPP